MLIMIERIENLVSQIKYKDWDIIVAPMGGGHSIQVVLSSFDPQTGAPWRGRKWYISNFMTDEEIVSTIFKAILTAEEHECRENFLFKGKAIYGPHLSLDALVENADRKASRLASWTDPVFDGPPKREMIAVNAEEED